MDIKLRSLRKVRNFSNVRAVAEVEYGGLLLRGLKLEEHGGEFRLEGAGRKISGGWQLVYELVSPDLAARLRDRLLEEYHRRAAV